MPLNRATLRGLLQQAGIGKLKDTGNGFAGLCPFHANTRTPAWGMNLDGLWNCMNPKCAEKGNLTTFLVRVLGMPLDQAMEYAPAESAPDDILTRRLPPYEERHTHGVEEQVTIPDATLQRYAKCPVYMLERGFEKAFLREMEIGLEEEAPWPDKTVTPAVTFPVRDHRSKQIIGFTKRALTEGAWPPYAHDFDKTQTLYLLHKVTKGWVAVTEGPCDALMLRQLFWRAEAEGVDKVIASAMYNAVATLGGRWSDDYALMLGRANIEGVVLAFDNDDAGRAARESAIRSLLLHGVTSIQLLNFPGHDPGDLVSDDVLDLSLTPYHRRMLRHTSAQ